MSFHKRYITKELILSNINDLDRIFNADAFIMDMWSNRFCDDLDKSERPIRNSINKKFKLSSSLSYQSDPQYKDLNSMSECLISLMTHPQWLDVVLVHDRLGVATDGGGDFNQGVEKCIKRIIEHYDKPNRNDKIEEILK